MITEIFNQLYDLAFHRIYAYFSACFGEQLADDLAQQTFLKVWQAVNKPAFIYPDKPVAWCFRIAINQKNDHLRKQYATPSSEELTEFIPLKSEDWTEKMAVEQAFSSLSQDKQELLILKANELNSKEIGGILHIPPSTVRGRLSVARKDFLTALEKEGVKFNEIISE